MESSGPHPENVLVTGGAGYIGSHVVLDLAAAGYFPIVVDNLSTGNSEAVLAGRLIKADVGDAAAIAAIIGQYGIKSALHFAAHIQVEESVRDPLKYYENNSLHSFSLIRTCLENGVTNFLFSSTAAVYGIPDHVPVSESAVLNPINPYGASKLFTEMVLRDAAIAHPHFCYVSLRYFNVAGADPQSRIGQNYANPTHLITLALKTALGIYPELKVFGSDYDTPDGTAIRDFIHVQDLSSAHILALQFLERERQNRIFNCGYGRGYSVLEVVDSVKRVTGIDFPVKMTCRREGDPQRLIADSALVQKELGWKPQYICLDDIIATAWNWERKLQQKRRIPVR